MAMVRVRSRRPDPLFRRRIGSEKEVRMYNVFYVIGLVVVVLAVLSLVGLA